MRKKIAFARILTIGNPQHETHNSLFFRFEKD